MHWLIIVCMMLACFLAVENSVPASSPACQYFLAPKTCAIGLYDFVVDVQGHYGYGSHPPGAEAEEARQEDAAQWHSLTARDLHPHGWEYTDPSLLNKPNSSLQALVRYASSLQYIMHWLCFESSVLLWVANARLLCASHLPNFFLSC